MTGIRRLGCLMLAVLLMAVALPAAAAPLSGETLALAYAVSAAHGQADSVYHFQADGTGYNPTHSYQIALSEAGLQVGTRAGSVVFSLVTLNGLPISTVERLYTDANRAELIRVGLTEWVVNGSLGVQHGFVVAGRPAGTADDGLRLTLALSGAVALAENGGGVVLAAPDGLQVAAYRGLLAWDAEGTPLLSRMIAEGDTLTLWVDDSRAVYPVTVDPLVEQAELLPGDSALGDRLGASVAISGNTAIVGAPDADLPGDPDPITNAGAAYVFLRTFPAAYNWALQQKLTASAPVADGHFGTSVAIEGNTALVGADSGAVVFTRSGSTWTQQTILVGADSGGDHREARVALSGTTALVGAPLLDDSVTEEGAVYVFTGSGASWTQQAKLTPPSLDSEGGRFGASVGLSGDVAVIGEPLDDTLTGADIGSAYVFTRVSTVWSLTETLAPSDGAAGDMFGSSVDVDGQTVVVGAPEHDASAVADAGAVYVYVESSGDYAQLQKLSPADKSASDYFGAAVALDADGIIAGAPGYNSGVLTDNGAVYVFRRSAVTGVWSPLSQRTAGDAASLDGFGAAVAVDVYSYVVGAPLGDADATDSGTAYALAGYEFLLTEANPPQLLEGNSTAPLPVRLTSRPISNVTLTVNPDAQCSVNGGAADVAATLTFTPANYAVTQNVIITAVDDDLVEDPHTCDVVYSASGDPFYSAEPAVTQTITILDDDAATVDISDASLNEGNNGVALMTFTVTISSPVPTSVTVDWNTVDDTATAPDDYTASSGTVSFVVSSTTPQTFSVPIVGDRIPEVASKQFFVNLTNLQSDFPALITLGDAQAVGTILDDDDRGAVELEDDTCVAANATDATFNAGEYPVANGGIGASFGDVIGTESRLLWDGDGSGKLVLGLETGGGLLDDFVVIYIDSVVGGFSGTAGFTDKSSPQASAVSGLSVSSAASAPLTFASGFAADYAIAFTQNPIYGSFSGLYQLRAGQPHVLITSLTPHITNQPSAGGYEFSGLSLNNLGVAAGDSFHYIATLINPLGAVRSNEFIGVETSPVGDIGAAPFSVAAGDFSTYIPYEPTSLSIDDVSAGEGDGALIFTVSLSRSLPDCQVIAFYSLADGSAALGVDYDTPTPLFVTLPENTTSASITVPLLEDTIDEPTETFSITLVNATNGAISTVPGESVGIGSIIDNDDPPVINTTAITVSETDAGMQDAVLIFTLSNPSAFTVSVDYATADGTALVDEDYLATSGTLTFDPLETEQTLSVPIVSDLRYEFEETLSVTLDAPVNGSLGQVDVAITVEDNDPLPSIAVIAPADVLEGLSGTTAMDFSVTLSQVAGVPVDVDYASVDGTALVADSDYQPVSGTLTFTPGQTAQVVTVLINGDNITESDKFLSVGLSNAVNGSITQPSANGVILNDDAAPQISVLAASAAETDADSFSAVMQVVLSNPSDQPVEVDFATSDGSAEDGIDYLGASGTLVFPALTTVQEASFTVNGDTLYEDDETVTVTLSAPVGGTLNVASADYTIVNDDTAPTLSIAAVSVTESNAGTVSANFTVTQSFITGADTTFLINTADDTALVSDDDYLGVVDLAASIPRGQTTYAFSIAVTGDTIYEEDETADVLLSAVQFADSDSSTLSATLTILNDDPLPTLTLIGPASTLEGDADDLTPLTYTLTLSNPSYQAITVDYAIEAGGADVADGDYQDLSGTLTFDPKQTETSLEVVVVGDDKFEDDEDFSLTLSAPLNVTLGVESVTTVILNDDLVPTLSWGDLSTLEGTGSVEPVDFVLTLSNPTEEVVTVLLNTTGAGTATPTIDYGALYNSLIVFLPGTTSSLPLVYTGIVPDGKAEGDETFVIALSGAANALLDTPSITVTILDDDSVVNLLQASDFEGDTSAWKIIIPFGAPANDKIVCVPRLKVAARSGGCVMQFSAGVGEATKLKQTVSNAALTASGVTFGPYDALRFSIAHNTTLPTAVLSIKLKQTYLSGARSNATVTLTFNSTGGSWVVQSQTVPVYAADLSKIVLLLTHRTPSGAPKFLVDDILIEYVPQLLAARQADPDAPSALPLPEAPDGWRGQ